MEAVLTYEKPQIIDYGDLAALTQAASAGGFLDADFPAGTPVGDLTFTDNP
jgi:hypothetical protein